MQPLARPTTLILALSWSHHTIAPSFSTKRLRLADGINHPVRKRGDPLFLYHGLERTEQRSAKPHRVDTQRGYGKGIPGCRGPSTHTIPYHTLPFPLRRPCLDRFVRGPYVKRYQVKTKKSDRTCRRIICLSVKRQRLCTSSMDILFPHMSQEEGSSMRPRSIITCTRRNATSRHETEGKEGRGGHRREEGGNKIETKGKGRIRTGLPAGRKGRSLQNTVRETEKPFGVTPSLLNPSLHILYSPFPPRTGQDRTEQDKAQGVKRGAKVADKPTKKHWDRKGDLSPSYAQRCTAETNHSKNDHG